MPTSRNRGKGRGDRGTGTGGAPKTSGRLSGGLPGGVPKLDKPIPPPPKRITYQDSDATPNLPFAAAIEDIAKAGPGAAAKFLVQGVFKLLAMAMIIPLVLVPWPGYYLTKDMAAIQSWSKMYDFLWLVIGVVWFLVIFIWVLSGTRLAKDGVWSWGKDRG